LKFEFYLEIACPPCFARRCGRGNCILEIIIYYFMSKDYYQILGVSKSASQDEIKKAFRKLAHEYHPDKKSGNEAKFKEINEAYQVLGNEEKRKQYDQFGQTFNNASGFSGGQGFGGFNWQDFARASGQGGFNSGNFSFNGEEFDLGDLFGDLFGGARSRSRAKQKVGEDIQIQLAIDFKEAIFGAEKIIVLDKQDVCDKCTGSGAEPGSKIITCPECHGRGKKQQTQQTFFGVFATEVICQTCDGTGKKPEKFCNRCHGQGRVRNKREIKITIPAGIDENQEIKIAGQGHVGPKGTSAGNLYVSFQIRPDRKFIRQGQNILTKINLNIVQASLGDKVEVETVDGPVILKIPESTESGKIFILKDKGVPELNRPSRRGDMLVEVFVKTPSRLSRKAKKILEELKEEII